MTTLAGLLSMLQGAGTNAEKEIVHSLALRSGLAWTCQGCGWLNAITDRRCFGDMTNTCTERPLVHLGSATDVHPDGDTTRMHTLALCGADLGPAQDFTGRYANYVGPETTSYVAITCEPCRAAFEARRPAAGESTVTAASEGKRG